METPVATEAAPEVVMQDTEVAPEVEAVVTEVAPEAVMQATEEEPEVKLEVTEAVPEVVMQVTEEEPVVGLEVTEVVLLMVVMEAKVVVLGDTVAEPHLEDMEAEALVELGENMLCC